jgi:DNA polymerase III gamma/tau subunit
MDKLLPTIKSRCQVIRFGPIEETRITDHLEQIGLDPKISKYFARLSQGSIGQAAQWANLELQGANLYKTKTNLIKSLSTYKYSDSLELAQFCLDETKRLSDNWQKLDESTSKADINRRAIKTLLQIVISAMLDAMKLRVNNNDDQQINFDQQPQIQILAHNFTADSASNAISNCYELIKWVDSSTNDKLIFEQLLLNLADTAII